MVVKCKVCMLEPEEVKTEGTSLVSYHCPRCGLEDPRYFVDFEVFIPHYHKKQVRS